MPEKDTSSSPTTVEERPPEPTSHRLNHDAQQHCPQVSRSPVVLADITTSAVNQASPSNTSFVTARKRKGEAKTIAEVTDCDQAYDGPLLDENKDLSPDQTDCKKQKSWQDDTLSEQSSLSLSSSARIKNGELGESFPRILLSTDSPQFGKRKGKEGLGEEKNCVRDTLTSLPVASFADPAKSYGPLSDEGNYMADDDEEEFISGTYTNS